MATIKNFKELIVWQKAHHLCVSIYKATDAFDKSEKYGLTSQIRRAAVSVPSNIVEGFDRGSNKEFAQFLTIARGSLSEVQAQILIAKDISYISEKQYVTLELQMIEVHKLINGLIRSIRNTK